MTKRKKFVSTICAIVVAVSISTVAGAVDMNNLMAEKIHTNTEMSASFNMDLPMVFVRQAGWKKYSFANLTGGGTWFGGIKDDGTLYSEACSKAYRSRVYVKTGKDSAKRWSGWANVGESSYKSAKATLKGNSCGYDLEDSK